MKVRTFQEFAALPAGTIFSFWEEANSTGLHVKGGMLESSDGKPIDFWDRSLLPEPILYDSITDPIRPQMDQAESRWGMFQFDQLFAVYESADLIALIDAAQFAIGVMDVCEHGVPCGDFCEPCNREYKKAAELGGEG